MSHSPRPPDTGLPSEGPLGLDDFVEPDDQGLSLDELSRAYAVLLNKGSDPYPDAAQLPGPEAVATESAPLPDEPPDLLPADDDACESVA